MGKHSLVSVTVSSIRKYITDSLLNRNKSNAFKEPFDQRMFEA